MSNTIARGQITFSDVLLVQEKSEVLSTWITINGTELADTVGDNGSYKLTKELADKYLTKTSTIVYTYRNGTGQQIFIYANNGSPVIKYVYPGIGVGNLDTAFYLLREFLRDSGLFTEAESFDESFDWSTYAMLLTSYYAQEMAISVAVNDIAQKTAEDARNALTQFVSQTYNPFASRIQSQVDQKAEVFYSNTDPSSGWSADEKPQHEGDIWCNISTQTLSGVNPGTLAIYSGSEWRMGNVPMEIVDQIDGKADIYTSLSASVTPKDKDLLIPLSDFTYSGVTYKANRVYRYNAASSVWVEIRYTTTDDFASFQDAVNASIKDLEDVVDNTIDYWFKTYNPTTSNAPASEWTTEQLKVQHLGDLFYNTDAGTVYRWIRTDNGGTYVYSWQQLSDDAASRALSLAQEAKDIADGKRRVFLATPQTSDTYDRGDLWLHATIGAWSNETLVAIVNKAAGTIVSPSHWEIASKYTDDTVAERAESKADSLTTIIGLFTDDDYISPPEKRALLNAYNNERDIKDTICATAANYGLDTTEVESYYDTYGDVIDYYCIYVKQLYDGRYNPYGWDDSIPIDNTHYPLSAIQDYYDAKAALQDEIDTAVSISLDAKAAKSDVQYLTTALAKDETVITGGLVLSSFIGVKDSTGVKAAINASTAVEGFKYKSAFSAVGDHGRLMIAAGINGVTTAYSTAATRIFEDGTVITNQLNADGGTIGGFVIGTDSLGSMSVVGGSAGYTGLVSGGKIKAESDYFRVPTSIVKDTKTFYVDASYQSDCILKISAQSMLDIYAPTLIELDAEEGNEAIKITRGHISGFRPRTIVVTSDYSLTQYDYNVIVNNSSQADITLPEEPEEGQSYVINHNTTTNFTLYPSGYDRIFYGDSVELLHSSTWRGLFFLTYCKNLNIGSQTRNGWICSVHLID